MRYYELLYIVRPTMGEDELKAFIEGVAERIKAEGGEILKNEVWQKRSLAYPIKKFKQGYYILVHYKSEADTPKRIEEFLRLKEDVLRFITTYMLKKDIKVYENKKEEDGKSE
ncbi:30S ribosomal protein S6 [Hippea maritima]|uniref:Small ribosomal subunit protein bS6 n=1 Tax=Hippea maritima (strain ATCC 700847 / DSM 10411 / MH2) TaxID=760142 RepID=F2LU76_HIPMA|nr:30S ribosomal protein S6 [Hippea maritima]AEA34539.1 30S ribosomal protein S6 [Hippea maritima DSM 10411]